MAQEIFATIPELLERAAEAGVFVLYTPEGLHFVVTGGGFPEALKSEISANEAALTEFLRQGQLEEDSTLSRPTPVDRTGPLPLSYAQRRLWFIDQLEPGTPLYNLPVALKLTGRLDLAAVQSSFNEIVRRHEVLRTHFRSLDGEPVQVIGDHRPLTLDVTDLSGEDDRGRRDSLAELLTRQEAQQPFDLGTGPLLRARLLRLAADEHVLLFTQHHIASDGWSLGILVREFSALYSAYCRGLESPLAPLPVQYADYAVWQRGWLQGEMLDEQLAYWERRLAGAPPVHSLPLKRERSAVQGREAVGHRRQLDEGLMRRLEALARREDVTLFMLLESAFALLVSRYSHEPDVVVGTPMAGRLHREVEGLVGFFINNLVLRSRFDEGETFRDYLARQRQTVLDAYAHQDVPFEMLVERLNPERSFGHDPVFQLVFSLDESEGGGLSLPGLNVSPVMREDGLQAKVDIEVVVGRGGGRTLVNWIYRAGLFDAGWVEELAAGYELLLRGIAEGPGRGLYDYEVVGAGRREALLAEGRGGEEGYPLDLCAHDLISLHARRTPSAVAVTYGTHSLSYQALEEKSRRLARYLAEAGVGPESRVGIHLRRTPEVLVAILGVLKCGGAYVPLEPGLPPQRLEYMLSDSGVEWVLTESELIQSLPLGGVDVVVMDGASSEADWLAEFASAEEPTARPAPDTLAYVLYTSGSTGQPKGVMVEHRGLTNYLSHAASSYLADGIGGSVVSSPLGFDATLTTLLTPLVTGRSVELLPDDETLMDLLAERLFGSEGALLFKLTPAHLEALQYVERPAQGGGAGHVIVVGGEQLGAALLAKWKRELLPAATFVNEYGPTEAVVGCSVWTLSDEDGLAALEGKAAAPIGLPIANTRLYVLGEGGRLQPRGSVGELYIGGAGVARGYLNRPGLSGERFLPDPFGGSEGGRLYRTGDLVRWLDGGGLAFVGRGDDQVKVRGYRVELGEIEQHLAGVAGVAAAAVAAREDVPGQKRLVAYVVPGGYAEAEAAEREALRPSLISGCREALAERLPEYMVPSAFVIMEALPLTPNGKVDRRALPAPDAGQAQGAQYVAPRDAVERAICEVWEEALNRERVGVEDNFFSLGGDSIISIRIVSMLSERGLSLDVRDIFRHQTVALLALQARDASPATEGPRLEPFALLTDEERASLAGDYEDAYPMSALQAGMVFHTQLEGFSGVYHDIVAEHVRCPWDEGRFEQALAACVEEHPVLRTGFLLGGERPLQVVYRSIELPLEVEDLRGLSDEEQEQYLSEWTEGRKHHVFDWERGPLFHTHIFLRTDDSFQFAVSFHHAVLDGWSRAVLTTQLYNRYERLLSDGLLEGVKVDWTYRDLVAQEQRVMADPDARHFFARMLEGAPAQQLPRLRAAAGARRSQAHLAVGGFTDLSARLVELARGLGVPVQAVLLAGHFKVLEALGGQRRPVSCVTQNGRPETAGAERSIGLYLNSLPLSLEPGGGSWRELIGQVAGLHTDAMQYRGYPLSKIQQDAGLSFEEVSFNYTHFHAFRELAASDTHTLQVLGSGSYEQTNFDLVVDVSRGVDDDSMHMALVYDPQVFGAGLVERMGDYYVRVFRLMLGHPDGPHDSEPLLGEDERRRLLLASAGPEAGYPLDLCAHELFSLRAEQTPSAVAATHAGRSLTYGELDEKSSRLARYLAEAGVGLESRVGIHLRRSPEMLVALLGVLRAGAAYVPLEAGLPPQRLEYMLSDSRVEWVLVESELMQGLPLGGVDVVVMDGASTDPGWLEEFASAEGPQLRPTPDSLAYILYTSGSTGQPKGVMVEHRGLTNYLCHAAEAYLKDGMEGSVVSSPLGFDATLTTLLAPLLAGRRVELLPDDETLMDGLAERLFGSAEPLLFKLTPAHLEALQYVERPTEVGGAGHVIVVGGEQLGAALLERWKRELLPAATFVNEYGPTEAVVGCTTWTLSDEAGLAELEGRAAAPIGLPIANTRVYVLDAHLRPSPEGVAGEVYVGGVGVARGYVNLPELTEERFVSDPFVAGGGRLYKTGDVGRWAVGGELEYIGRN
ncbi:MAG TPA: amino acid adenylation domain-containing protein, partial [Pyrinomonadaceae bacterium]|nr:amino acid adenylation domain-containing protein [Pyrinomonadaceae bacterium]